MFYSRILALSASRFSDYWDSFLEEGPCEAGGVYKADRRERLDLMIQAAPKEALAGKQLLKTNNYYISIKTKP